jgi:hypothetical protein
VVADVFRCVGLGAGLVSLYHSPSLPPYPFPPLCMIVGICAYILYKYYIHTFIHTQTIQSEGAQYEGKCIAVYNCTQEEGNTMRTGIQMSAHTYVLYILWKQLVFPINTSTSTHCEMFRTIE